MLYTAEQIAQAAQDSTFYVTSDGNWLRIEHTDSEEGYFQALDEDSFEEYTIYFADLAEEHDPEFHRLVRTQIA